MTKRVRMDGQISKEEYDWNLHNDADDSSDPFTRLKDARATPNTLGSRKMVVAQRKDKKTQLAKHLNSLNSSFYDWIKVQLKQDPYADLSDGFQDYVDYSTSLEDRYLRKYGEVLTFGNGDCGQLAHGTDNTEDLEVKFPRIVYSLREKKVVGIACGGLHNAVYTATGQVYTWGCADDGSLGRQGEESVPLLVESLTNEFIIRIACGDGQTIAVSTKGDVWGWGCYKDKEGKKWFNPASDAPNPTKDIKKQQNTPLKITGLSNVVDVACGASFNLARTSDGNVYSWGIGECGELGRFTPPMKAGEGEEVNYDLPNILKHQITPGSMFYSTEFSGVNDNKATNDLNKKKVIDVKAIGCGAYHSMLAIVGDKVFCCGLNNYGQLGTNDTKNRVYLTEVLGLEGKGIIALQGGMHHSLALSSTGQMYAFGRGDSGQLGTQEVVLKNSGDFCPRPVRPFLPEGVVVTSFGCGGNHNLVLTDKGDVYTWGYGDMLALGHGEDKDEIYPKKVNFLKAKIKNITITQVAGGGQHSAIIGQVIGV